MHFNINFIVFTVYFIVNLFIYSDAYLFEIRFILFFFNSLIN